MQRTKVPAILKILAIQVVQYSSHMSSPSSTPADLSTLETDRKAIMKWIIEERRVELAFEEGHRWFDLVRTGRATTVLNFTDVNKYLMPIPSQQLLVDPALTQNPGY